MALYPNERKVNNCLLSWIHCKLNLLHAVLKRILEGKNESPKLERKNVNFKDLYFKIQVLNLSL